MNLYNVIDRTLDADVTPLAYIHGVQGVITGVSFSFLASVSPGVQNTVLYKQNALIGVDTWGLLYLASSLILLGAMLMKSKRFVMAASMGGFTAWSFAAIVYGMNGYGYYLLPVALMNMLAWGYFFLATSLNRLWNYTPDRG